MNLERSANIGTKIALRAIRAYQLLVSSWLGNCCRFYPSCSDYGLEALRKKGLLIGTFLTAARLLRCHPFCPGGHEPVPQ